MFASTAVGTQVGVDVDVPQRLLAYQSERCTHGADGVAECASVEPCGNRDGRYRHYRQYNAESRCGEHVDIGYIPQSGGGASLGEQVVDASPHRLQQVDHAAGVYAVGVDYGGEQRQSAYEAGYDYGEACVAQRGERRGVVVVASRPLPAASSYSCNNVLQGAERTYR